jgi:hypothetical protein
MKMTVLGIDPAKNVFQLHEEGCGISANLPYGCEWFMLQNFVSVPGT